MFTTILIILLCLATAAAFLIGPRIGRYEEVRTPGRYGMETETKEAGSYAGLGRVIGLCLSVFTLVVAAFSMLTIVGPTEVGVPISFGQVGSPLTSGLHVVAPWVGVETYPIRPFAVDDMDVKARTSQAGSVTYRVGARWHVDPAQARETYLQIRSGDEDVISQKIVDPNLATAAGNIATKRDNLSATTDRIGVEADLLAEVNRLVQSYGIKVDQVFLRHIEPDATTAQSIAQLASQQQRTKIAAESVQTASQQAKAREVEAQGLQQAANTAKDVTGAQAYALCVQSWERMTQYAIDHGQTLYSQPCGGANQAPLVTAK
jgi:regulator of protease activity HflC (stomatin/prohibitin superfamily)